MSTQTINYEELVASYEDRLLNQLRSHGVDLDFLEMWVPDEDLVASVLNMVEAAGAFGTDSFSIRISTASATKDALSKLAETLSEVSDVEIESHEDHSLVHISNIRA